jgi:predicted RNA-binding Zn-ribbon protein involved in translation (DUF1610 family)
MDKDIVNFCPKCGEHACPKGNFMYTQSPVIPLNVKKMFVTLTFNVQVRTKYCPKCGLLETKIIQV